MIKPFYYVCKVDELTEKNDDGWTFIDIADYIERNWNTDTNETVE